jgi:hypothetical protein
MTDVFIKKADAPEPGFSVGVLLSRKPTSGTVGLEIEVEGNKFKVPEGHKGTHHAVQMPDLPFWSYVHDGSLRGKDNAEYVLSKPIAFDEVAPAVKSLWDMFAAYGSVLDESNRTSVHVHLNCQSFHFNRLTSLMALYFAFEEVLTAWCGEHRTGNLFCLRAKDAPAIISQVRKFIKTDGKIELRDHLHYSGLNTSSLHKFGSLEIRTMRGVTDPSLILDWVGILQRLYELSADFPDPRDICGMFSQGGPVAFFDDILGEKASVVRAGISMDEDAIKDSMYDGIRMAQDLCYCRDWGLFQAIDLKADPFGRDPRKVMKKLSNVEAQMAVQQAIAEIGYDEPEYFDEHPQAQVYIAPSPVSAPASLNQGPSYWTTAGQG